MPVPADVTPVTAATVCQGQELGSACQVGDSQGKCQQGNCCEVTSGERGACHTCLTCVPVERPLETVVLPAFPTTDAAAPVAASTVVQEAAPVSARTAAPAEAPAPPTATTDAGWTWAIGAAVVLAAVAALWWRGRPRG